MEWYYVIGKEQKGPVNESKFKDLCNNATISGQTLVWNKTMTDWQPYEQVRSSIKETIQDDLNPPEHQSVADTNKNRCTECGKPFADDELVAFQDALICAGCKPIFLQKIREGVSTGPIIYAGFWIRFVAKFVDWIIMMIISVLINFAFGTFTPMAMNNPENITATMLPSILAMLLQWSIMFFYVIWFVGKHAATPGKMICGLKIVTPQNGKVTYMRAFGRCFAEILSGITLYIGYIMAGFDSEKRALHDRICATRVIKK